MRYEHSDAQGSVIAETNATRAIIKTSVYSSWGGLLNHANDDAPGYTGHLEDSLTGLTYMQQRYYDPSVGRFLSMDPVGVNTTGGGNFNRYWYAKDNPYKYIDPDGRTCTKVGKSYSCQIDYIATKVKGGFKIRAANANDHKTYAKVEKLLTQAVNRAATSGKTAAISVRSDGHTFAFTISGSQVAKNLVRRRMVVVPGGHWYGAMYSPNGNDTYINQAGINGTYSKFGGANRTRQVEFIHEGIHWSSEERKAFGAALPTLGDKPRVHQDAYNDAASELLGH